MTINWHQLFGLLRQTSFLGSFCFKWQLPSLFIHYITSFFNGIRSVSVLRRRNLNAYLFFLFFFSQMIYFGNKLVRLCNLCWLFFRPSNHSFSYIQSHRLNTQGHEIIISSVLLLCSCSYLDLELIM